MEGRRLPFLAPGGKWGAESSCDAWSGWDWLNGMKLAWCFLNQNSILTKLYGVRFSFVGGRMTDRKDAKLMSLKKMLHLLLDSLVPVIAGAVAFFSIRFFDLSSENMGLRIRLQEKQTAIESIQPRLMAARQQLQAQQERLNRGFAISEKVGPAILADMQFVAEKPGAQRVRDLLVKHRMLTDSPAARGGK